MKFRWISILILLLISVSKAQDLTSTVNADTGGTRSAIVDVDWYEYLSDNKSIGEIRRSALNAAKREALERANTYIKSITKIENYELKYDLIMSGTQGYIKVLDSKDYGITADNRYRYWIKAEVEYILEPPKEAAAASDITYSTAAPLTVRVWTHKQRYRSKEEIHIFVQGNKDFYGRVLYQDAAGNLLQLLPNPLRTNNYFKGGQVSKIPDMQDRFKLEVTPPFGTDQIIVYASTAPIGNVNVENVNNALYSVRGGLDQVARQTRGVQIITQSEAGGSEATASMPLSSGAGAEFYEATCKLTTEL